MSLIHWWPLNGDTKDYGVKNLNGYLLSGATFNNAGKIGKCLVADNGNGTGNGVGIPSNLLDELSDTDYSFCAWIKINGDHVHYEGAIISSGDWNRYCWAFGLNSNNTAINPAGNWYHSDYVEYTFETGKWYHIVSTQHDTTSKVYVNGVLIGTVTHGHISASDSNETCIGRETYAGGYFGFNGEINDVRIYDHCLSAKEVKEISKGLVLHYNFEDAYAEGTTNLINQNGAITYTVRCSTYKNGVTIDWTNPDNQGDTYFVLNAPEMTSGVTYTFSFDCEGLLADSDVVWAVSNTYAPAKIHNGRNAFTFTATSSVISLFFDDWSRDTRLSNLRMTNFQLETKDHATPYVNGTRPNGLIYDNSGYGYNGTQTGSLQILEDSASGKYSIFSPSGANYVERQNIPLDCFNATQEFTITCWLKVLSYNPSDTWNTIFRLAASDGRDLQLHMCYDYRGKIILSQYSDDPEFNSGIELNKWVHLTWVHYKEGSAVKCKYYVNGSLIGTGTYSGALNIQSNPRLTLFYDSIRGGYGSSSYLGDFKMFSTALSADDILAEYNRKASIDKTGKLFASYVNEYETTTNIGELADYYIETQHAFDGRFGPITEATYNAYYPNGEPGLGDYTQGNLLVTMTSQGIRIYSEPNRDGRAQEGSEWNTWGGFCWSPMKQCRCLFKGHHYRISWHVKGQSSRAMDSIFWSNQVGWGQWPDAEPTVHKLVTHPANFQGEMDCFYDFTIEDDIFKTTGSETHSGFDPNTSYLAYSAFKIGYTYDFTGELGTDIYITNLKLYDLTTGDVYKVEKNGIVKTTEAVAGRRDSARLHSDGVIDATDIEEY